MSFEGKLFEPRNVASWLLFSLGAGTVNAGAVLASNTVVSHVTGSVTNLALDGSLATVLAFVVGSFLAGAMGGSFFAESFKMRPVQAFVAPVAVSSAILFVVSSLGGHGAFGVFGVGAKLDVAEVVMLGLLSASMGVLNAGVAAATGNKIRTTHLSGPITDLGGNLVRGALDTGEGRRPELRWAALRFAMLAAFACGAVLAERLSTPLEYRVFFVAAGVLAFASALAAPSLSERVESEKRDEREKREEPVVEERTFAITEVAEPLRTNLRRGLRRAASLRSEQPAYRIRRTDRRSSGSA